MEPTSIYRPRVSRETRLLLTAGVLAIVALWLLARVRFPDRPAATSGPIPAVLSQLTPGSSHDDLAAEIAGIQPRVNGSLIVLEGRVAAGAPERAPGIVALRFRDELAVTVLPGGPRAGDASVVATDPATHLTVLRVKAQPAAALGPPWTPRRPERPRYFVATDATPAGISLVPAFVGSLAPVTSARWPAGLWAVPASSQLSPGAFVYTSAGDFAGLVTDDGAGRVIVPGETLFAEAERLLSQPIRAAGTLGVEVQALTPSIAAATGAAGGVVATWVDPAGPASDLLVGDVIEAVDQRPVGRDEWEARMARLPAGQTLSLRVRSRGEVRDVAVAAAPFPPAPAPRPLGLTLRQRRGVGAEVVRVAPASLAARAGLGAGDVITVIGAVRAPTPAQVTRSFSSLPDRQPILVGVTRGDAHFVTAIER
jgi:S1-C subfamily serine protease